MVRCVRCLLCKSEGLSSDPHHPRKTLACQSTLAIPVLENGDMRISRACWPASLANLLVPDSVKNLVHRLESNRGRY